MADNEDTQLFLCEARRELSVKFYVRAVSQEQAQADADALADSLADSPEKWELDDDEVWVAPDPVPAVHEALPTWSGGPDGDWE